MPDQAKHEELDRNSQDERVVEQALVNYRPYPQRWYILILFALLTCMQGTIWNSWSPVAESAKAVFPTWNDGTIALFTNWGSITYLIFVIPICWTIEASLGKSVIFAAVIMALGAGLRCIPLQLDPDSKVNQDDILPTIAAHICAIFNGVAGIVFMAAPPAISAVWFPMKERTTATSIGQISAIFAVSASFLMGVEIVHDFPHEPNSTNHITSNYTPSQKEIAVMRNEIRWLMWAQALPVFILTLFAIMYYPETPPTPPSRSSEQPRLAFIKGIKQVVKNPNAWLIAGVIGIPNAILAGWVTLMGDFLPDLCFESHPKRCLTPNWISWLGVVTNLSAGLGALLVAWITDRLRGHIKQTLIGLLSLATVGFTLLSLVCLKVWTFGQLIEVETAFYMLLPISTSLVAATIPLSTELAVEICFPAAEVVVNGWITLWVNVFAMLFYFAFNIPGVGTDWLNYILPIGMAATVPLAILVKDTYRRSDIDINNEAFSATPEELSPDSTPHMARSRLRLQQ